MIKTKPVRYVFFVTAVLAMAMTVYNVFFLYPAFTKILIKHTEAEAVKLGTHLSEMYFNGKQLLTKDDIAAMKSNAQSLLKDFNLMELKAFSSSGEVFYSTDPVDIGEINQHDYFHNYVSKGLSYTKVVKKDNLTLEGHKTLSDVVETYVPIMSKGKFIGAFEMYYDVTAQLKSFNAVKHQSILIHLIMLLCGISITTIMMIQLDRSIVRQEEIEEDLKVFSGQLHKSNCELESFAHIASHDLQEPLRKVVAFGDRLKSRYSDRLDEKGLDYLERMHNAAIRMQTLIDGLLTYSRVTSKAQPFTQVNLSSVTAEVISDLEERIKQTGGVVEVENLPDVNADPLQMRQLLQNLIGNALKFHKKDKPPVIRIAGSIINAQNNAGIKALNNKICEITCKDNGVGFEEQYATRIFGVFQRLHGRADYEGSGIGLSVCKKIVERHGGSIEAKSSPGEGATFIIRLPVEQPDAAAKTVE